MNKILVQDYQQISGELRLKILELYHQANAGHIGCSLSCIDLMIAALILEKQTDEDFILSKGHAAAALYVCLNYTGEISDQQLQTFYQDGTVLSAHPAPRQFAGIPFATGSLGHGLPIATGIAQANQLLKKNHLYTYVLMSDGETNEGTTWEAAHYAVRNRLDNLIVLIDKNGLQGFGRTADVLGDTTSRQLWEAIGFEVFETDGHDVASVINTIKTCKNHRNLRPKVIVAQTVKGKGVSYMEDKLEWHYLPMSASQYEQAKADVRERYQCEIQVS